MMSNGRKFWIFVGFFEALLMMGRPLLLRLCVFLHWEEHGMEGVKKQEIGIYILYT